MPSNPVPLWPPVLPIITLVSTYTGYDGSCTAMLLSRPNMSWVGGGGWGVGGGGGGEGGGAGVGMSGLGSAAPPAASPSLPCESAARAAHDAPAPCPHTHLQARDVALGAVRHKHLVGGDQAGVEGVGNGLAQRALALFGAVAARGGGGEAPGLREVRSGSSPAPAPSPAGAPAASLHARPAPPLPQPLPLKSPQPLSPRRERTRCSPRASRGRRRPWPSRWRCTAAAARSCRRCRER
jgi:hypothetical protein